MGMLAGALGGGAGAVLGAAVAWAVRRILKRELRWAPALPVAFAIFGASMANAMDRAAADLDIGRQLDAIAWVQVLKAHYPEDYARLRDKVLAAGGRDDAQRALLETSIAVTRRQTPRADAGTVVEMFTVQRDEGRALQKVDAAGCAAFMDGRGVPPGLAKAITPDLVKRESASVATLLRQTATQPAAPAAPMTVGDLARISFAATAGFRDADQDLVIDVLRTARDPQTAEEGGVMCAYHLALADYLLARPPGERGALIRSLLALYDGS